MNQCSGPEAVGRAGRRRGSIRPARRAALAARTAACSSTRCRCAAARSSTPTSSPATTARSRASCRRARRSRAASAATSPSRRARSLIFNFNSAYTRNQIHFIPDGNYAYGFALNVGPRLERQLQGRQGRVRRRDDHLRHQRLPARPGADEQRRPLHHRAHDVVEPDAALTNRFALGYDYVSKDNQTILPFGFLNLRSAASTSPTGTTRSSRSTTPARSSTSPARPRVDVSRGAGSCSTTATTSPTSPAATSPGPATRRSRARRASPSARPPAARRERRTCSSSRCSAGATGCSSPPACGWTATAPSARASGCSGTRRSAPRTCCRRSRSGPKRCISTLKLRTAIGESGKAPGAFDAVRTYDPIAADEGKPGVHAAAARQPEPRSRAHARVRGRLRRRRARRPDQPRGHGVPLAHPRRAHRRHLSADAGLQPRAARERRGRWRTRASRRSSRATSCARACWSGAAASSYTALSNKAVDLGGQIISMGSSVYVREGAPVPAYYGVRVTNPDAFADPVVEQNAFLGSAYADHLLNLGTTLRLRQNLSLDLLGEYQGGGLLGNFTGYQNARRGVWYPCYGTQQKLRAFAAGRRRRAQRRDGAPAREVRHRAPRWSNSDYWIESTSFFKLRSASLAYKLPRALIPRTQSATITLAGRNLFKSTDYDGLDPELRDASDQGAHARPPRVLPAAAVAAVPALHARPLLTGHRDASCWIFTRTLLPARVGAGDAGAGRRLLRLPHGHQSGADRGRRTSTPSRPFRASSAACRATSRTRSTRWSASPASRPTS